MRRTNAKEGKNEANGNGKAGINGGGISQGSRRFGIKSRGESYTSAARITATESL